jgi:5-methylcytosine-specific restriction protein A
MTAQALVLGGVSHPPGDTIIVSASTAANLLAAGLAVCVNDQGHPVPPPDAVLALMPAPAPEGVTEPPVPAVEPADPGHEPDTGVVHAECDPGPRPKARKSMQRCPEPDCQCFTWVGKCRECKRRAKGGTWARSGHNVAYRERQRWACASRAYLIANPLCASERCSAIAAPLRPAATEVDHVDGLGLKGPRAFDETNWQALCKQCHSAKTASESFGR